MATYKVGTLRQSGGGFADFLFQSTQVSVSSQAAEGKDENGNLKVMQHYDQRLKVRVQALIPRDVDLPVPGQAVELEGISVPVIAADGSVSSGSLTVTDPDGSSGSGGAAALTFLVTGEPQIDMSNEKISEVTFECVRSLINDLPAAVSSSSP